MHKHALGVYTLPSEIIRKSLLNMQSIYNMHTSYIPTKHSVPL